MGPGENQRKMPVDISDSLYIIRDTLFRNTLGYLDIDVEDFIVEILSSVYFYAFFEVT